MKKLLLPLLLIVVSGLAAEPPVVKSKAAQELLKHPEFKKALEAAPEFTKAILAELDKHAPAPTKKLTLDGVIRWDTETIKSGIKLPQWNALDFDKDKTRAQLAEFYDGWTLEKWKSVFGKPETFDPGEDPDGRKYFWMAAVSGHSTLYNPVTEQTQGLVFWDVDRNTLRVVRVYVSFGEQNEKVPQLPTPYGKKLGFKRKN